MTLLTHHRDHLHFSRPGSGPTAHPTRILLCVPTLPLLHGSLTEKCRRSRCLHPLHADVSPSVSIKSPKWPSQTTCSTGSFSPRRSGRPLSPSPAPMQKPNPPSYVRLYCYRGPCDSTEPQPQAHRLDRHLTKWTTHICYTHWEHAASLAHASAPLRQGFEAHLLHLFLSHPRFQTAAPGSGTPLPAKHCPAACTPADTLSITSPLLFPSLGWLRPPSCTLGRVRAATRAVSL